MVNNIFSLMPSAGWQVSSVFCRDEGEIVKSGRQVFSARWFIKIGLLNIEKAGEPVLPNRFPIQGLCEDKNTGLAERPLA
jgi:hypothetical protein